MNLKVYLVYGEEPKLGAKTSAAVVSKHLKSALPTILNVKKNIYQTGKEFYNQKTVKLKK